MTYTAEEILESGDYDIWDESPENIDRVLEDHGMKRGTGVDDYNGPNNLKDLALWLGY